MSESLYVPDRKFPIMCTCTKLLCSDAGALFLFRAERSLFCFSSEAVLLSRDFWGLDSFSILPVLFLFFFSFSSFCFLMHAEVLCKFFISQNLQNNLSLGKVHAADMCPFLPQALQALVCTLDPLYRFFSLYTSDRRDALSFFIII